MVQLSAQSAVEKIFPGFWSDPSFSLLQSTNRKVGLQEDTHEHKFYVHLHLALSLDRCAHIYVAERKTDDDDDDVFYAFLASNEYIISVDFPLGKLSSVDKVVLVNLHQPKCWKTWLETFAFLRTWLNCDKTRPKKDNKSYI